MNSSNTQPEEEFFIGWERDLPPLQRRFLYHRLFGIFAFVFSLGLLIPFMQQRYEPSFYKYMSKANFEGLVVAEPVPALLVNRPGTIGNKMLDHSRYLLVNPKKYGFPAELAHELDGQEIRMKGALVFNQEQTLVEVVPKSIQVIDSDLKEQLADEFVEIGKYQLNGEIVDSKSFYGALNPGFGKPSRACAVRSIANGIPPLLLIRDESGETAELLVVGGNMKPIGHEILDKVAVPIRATGIVYRWGDKYIYKTDPNAIHPVED